MFRMRAGCTPLHLAAQNGHNQSGRTLLYGGCSPDVKNNYGDTPLHTSARYGHAGIARILISARCSIAEQNKNGDTALHITSAFKRRKIAKLLVEAGIDTLIKNKQDETAVDTARRKDHTENIEIIHQAATLPMHTYSQHPKNKKIHTVDIHHDSTAKPLDTKADKELKKKSHNAFVSWIRKKFVKKPAQSKRRTGLAGQPAEEDDVGLINKQYIKKPGFAYYRDLAGNIRQGPCGFVPACPCEPSVPPVIEKPTARRPTDYADIKETQLQLSKRMAELKMAAENHKHQGMNDRPDAAKQPDDVIDGDVINKRRQIQQLSTTEKERMEMNRQLARVENDLQELRGDLKTWLITQTEEGTGPTMEDNPFAYAVGASQMRFGDDFDHERMARYDATEQFPPPPRLFRSRSDETLSHSEYSYHGRAFKSREAAMEELKTLKHHEELRARRKRIRAGGDDLTLSYHQLSNSRSDSRSTLRPAKSNTSIKDSNKNPKSQHSFRHSSRPNLWHSRENVRQKDQGDINSRHAAQTDRESAIAAKPWLQDGNALVDDPQYAANMAHKVQPRTMNAASAHSKTTALPPKVSSKTVPEDRPAQPNNNHMLPASLQPRQPATYKLISAALSHSRAQNAEPTTISRPPIPAQRSHTNSTMMSNETALNRNTPPRENVVCSKPFSNYVTPQHLLYPESQQTTSHYNHTLASRQQATNYNRQYNSNPSMVVSQPLPQAARMDTNDVRQPLPSYDEVQGKRSANSHSDTQRQDCSTRPPTAPAREPHPLYPKPAARVLLSHESTKVRIPQDKNNAAKLSTQDGLVVQTGESCCGSSNPDSGYGGPSYDFYASQPSPQQVAGGQNGKDYDAWYNRRLQDAARRITTYSALRPQRTMTSDV